MTDAERFAVVLRMAANPRVHQRRLHSAADAYESLVRDHAMHAFTTAKASIDRDDLQRVLAHGHQAAEEAMDGVVASLRRTLQRDLPTLLLEMVRAGGAAAATNLRSQLRIATSSVRAAATAKVSVSFNAQHPAASAWAQEHAAELVDGISATSRERIRDAIASGLDGDLEMADIVEEIMNAVGDESRADMIARTETMMAVNEGQREMWDQAVEDGYLTGNEKRVWIAAADCCDDCTDLDGETADQDDDYPDDGADGPPLHPNCRCTEGLQM